MVRLSELAKQLNLKSSGNGDVEISAITEDSRQVVPGTLFVAVPGVKFNGRDFISDAINRGAAAIMMTTPAIDLSVPSLIMPQGSHHALMAQSAAIIYSQPAEQLSMIGLTGTNGKTTSSYLLESVLSEAGLAPGVMGTINARWAGQTIAADNTTPAGPLVYRYLAQMSKAGSKAAIMEVSSHALNLGRIEGLIFDAALFTNLSRDHLDFHSDMEDYYQAKKLLFTKHLKPGGKRAVINIDDEYGQRMAQELGSAALGYGFSDKAQVRGSNLTTDREGLSLVISGLGVQWIQNSPLFAEINGYNILAVAALGLALGLDPKMIKAGLAKSTGAPGRLEKAGSNADYLVLVDYSHTPDSLAKALKACRDLEPKRVLTVFGCGGDRDAGKRSIMGRVAAELADLTIITSDNPRTEEPWSIIEQVEKGLDGLGLTKFEVGELTPDWPSHSYLALVDRRSAIREAIRLMDAGDVLLIAGKGHENYQILGYEKRHFDDCQEALEALKREGRDK